MSMRQSEEWLSKKLASGAVRIHGDKRLTPVLVGPRPNTSNPKDASALISQSKFGNVKTEVDGVLLDSRREARRWKELRLLLRSGRLLWLARQVEFILPGGIIYKADFVYWDGDMAKKFTVEDAKGYLTPEYKMKKRLMKERGFEIVEV